MLNIKKKPAEQRVFASLKIGRNARTWNATLEKDDGVYCQIFDGPPTFGQLLEFVKMTGTSPQNVRITL